MSSKRIPFFYNKKPITFINDFEIPKKGIFRKSKSSLDGIDEVELSSLKNEFKVEFDFNKYSRKSKNIGVGDVIKKVNFDSNEKTIIFNSVFIGRFSNQSLEGSINELHSKGFSKSKKQYFKFVIPNSKSLDIHFQIDHIVIENDYGIRSSVATKINLMDEEIFIMEEKDENKNKYIIIESRKKQTYEEFSNKTFAIRIALGYVSGYFAGNKGYFFSYSNAKMENYNDFYFTSLRDEIKTLMNPINTNPFSWLNDYRKVAEKYYKLKIFRPLTISEFSFLCNKLITNDEFTATILLIIESTKASLIFRPSGYSIALETLSDIIIGAEKEKIAPINSKQDFKDFKIDLIEVLNKHSTKESFIDVNTLKVRIENINQITNLESLKKPFSILGITLLDEDLKVIKSRNDFLHGRVPDFKKQGANRSIELKDYDLYYASVRLYTLLNVLIFKMIGFDNYILNFPKIYEKNTKFKVKEKHYRRV
ncbi:hypothetical protein DI487_12820 [Flavobacterium sediminis]|uniref:ApeA N-terminal domain-containing protein n=1 Tax=Flavobacterium sediminis TaxID=2201181 RepID=A0A2U8QWR4_9FLAO|nr:hypothetical protein [Flavobacterium sediminis]AWM14650.1 hypothetical protein DI487_12820 [Flavobacterium sediminis]